VPSPPLPNFLIIGAQRSATRWLRTNLQEHPQVFTATVALSYFSNQSRMKKRGLRAYANQFEAWSGEKLVGESSPNYLLLGNQPDQVARRIEAALPDVRLIAVVRQPIERMHSALLHHIKRGRLPADADLYRMVVEGHPDVDELDLLAGGLYHRSLLPYQERFGDRLLVVPMDDIRSDPAKVYATVLEHLGADPSYESSSLNKVLFSNRRSVRATGPKLTTSQVRTLYMLFRPDVEELEAMTGRYLPEWDPGPPGPRWAEAFANRDLATTRLLDPGTADDPAADPADPTNP
jgi:hypothetical protein